MVIDLLSPPRHVDVPVDGYDVEAHYDAIAQQYHAAGRTSERKQLLLSAALSIALAGLKRFSVLDLGCGGGFFSRHSVEAGAERVVGVDISQQQLRIATEINRGLPITWLHADVTSLDLNERFDAVLAAFVFNYSPRRDVLEQQMATAFRHLKPGGKLFAIVAKGPSAPDNGGSYRVNSASTIDDGSPLLCEFLDEDRVVLCVDYKYFWSATTLEDVIRTCGFHRPRWIELSAPLSSSRVLASPSSNVAFLAQRP